MEKPNSPATIHQSTSLEVIQDNPKDLADAFKEFASTFKSSPENPTEATNKAVANLLKAIKSTSKDPDTRKQENLAAYRQFCQYFPVIAFHALHTQIQARLKLAKGLPSSTTISNTDAGYVYTNLAKQLPQTSTEPTDADRDKIIQDEVSQASLLAMLNHPDYAFLQILLKDKNVNPQNFTIKELLDVLSTSGNSESTELAPQNQSTQPNLSIFALHNMVKNRLLE